MLKRYFSFFFRTRPTSSDDVNFVNWRESNHRCTSQYAFDGWGILATLTDGQWLNDEVVNMRLIKDKVPDVGIIDSFFVTAIKTGRDADQFQAHNVLLNYEKVLIPVNKDSHWSLVVFDVKYSILKTVDSRTGNNTNALIISQFLIQQSGAGSTKFVLNMAKKIPKQKNSYDCRVFTL